MHPEIANSANFGLAICRVKKPLHFFHLDTLQGELYFAVTRLSQA
jgi:hypothetical protein